MISISAGRNTPVIPDCEKERLHIGNRGVSFIIVSGMLCASVCADFSAWQYSAELRIITSKDWADIDGSETVTDFPLLVRLEEGYFDFSRAAVSGQDIRFSKDNNTALPHEIELWDAAGTHAAVWVKVDTITGNDTLPIFMYWGNPAAPDVSNGAAVFETGNGFAGVWHAGEASGKLRDATANGLHATFHGNLPAARNGLTGSAQRLDGDGDFMSLDRNLYIDGTYSLQTWFRADDDNRSVFIMGEDDDPAQNDAYCYMGMEDDGMIRYFQRVPAGSSQTTEIFSSSDNAADGYWHHIAATFDGMHMRLYFDGDMQSEEIPGSSVRDSVELYFGINFGTGSRFFNGLMDEMRISTEGRSAAWIKLCYANQGVQRLVTLPVVQGCIERFEVLQDTISMIEGETFSASGISDCALRYFWSVIEEDREVPVAPDGFTLIRTPGRITSDTVYVFRFNALYETGWQRKDVAVKVKENIPDPDFSLLSPVPPGESWNGLDTLVIEPVIHNLAAIKASTAPDLNYEWSTSGAPVSTKEITGAFLLRMAYTYESDSVTVRLCMDNGHVPVCREIGFPVDRTAGIMEEQGIISRSVDAVHGFLTWNRPARIRIWSTDGKLLLDERGEKGKKLRITPEQQQTIERHPLMVEIHEEGKD